jgi:hypothetical protein
MASRRTIAAGQLTFTDIDRPAADSPPPRARAHVPAGPAQAGSCAPALPRLLDRKGLAAEMGLPRSVIDAVFRALPVVAIEGLRKPMVRREDVLRLLEESTFRDGERVR